MSAPSGSALKPIVASVAIRFLKFLNFVLGFFERSFFPRRESRQHILIPAYTGLGNFVLKTPLLKALRQTYPDLCITILCGNSYGVRALAEMNGVGAEIAHLPEKAGVWEAAKFYLSKRRQFDTALLFFDTSHIGHLYWGTILAGIPERIGHVGDKIFMPPFKKRCLTKSVSLRHHTHEIDLNYDLLKISSLKTPILKDTGLDIRPIRMSPALSERIRSYTQGKRYSVIQLSAANGSPTPKMWLADSFVTLLQRLIDQGEVLVVVGDTNERDRAGSIVSQVRGKILDLTGETSIQDMLVVLSEASFVVSHDSGIMHLASALGRPLVAIIGPGDAEKNKPLKGNSICFASQLPCAPCIGLNGKWSESEAVKNCPIQFKCMRDISVDDVFSAIKKLRSSDTCSST